MFLQGLSKLRHTLLALLPLGAWRLSRCGTRVADVLPPVVRLAPTEHLLRLGIRLERLELAQLPPHRHAGVPALEQLGRGEVDRVVVVGGVEDLEAEIVGDKAAVHQLPEVARVNVPACRRET